MSQIGSMVQGAEDPSRPCETPRAHTQLRINLPTWHCEAVPRLEGEQWLGGRFSRSCFFKVYRVGKLKTWPVPLYPLPLRSPAWWLGSAHPASPILNGTGGIHPRDLFSPDCLGKSLINMLLHRHKKRSFIFCNK